MTGPPSQQVLHAQTWFARVAQADAAATLQAQATFIRQFMGQLFSDMDNGQLPDVQSAHFHRLGNEVRFRVIVFAPTESLVAAVEQRLNAATTDGMIEAFRSEPPGVWGTPDPAYGTDMPNVPAPFTQFLESISRATVAILLASNDFRVSEQVLWHWLHLVHNPMTGLERHLVEVAPQPAVHRL